MGADNPTMHAGFDPRTASAAALEQARQTSYEGASPAGKKAQGAFALWAAANRIPVEEVNRVIASSHMQFALKLPDVAGTDIAEAAERASLEVGAWKVDDALRQPVEKLMLIAAVG